MNDEVTVYQQAFSMIHEYGDEEIALQAILKAILELQSNDDNEATINQWIRIGDAIRELKDLANGETTLH